ncbi:hypothetical protein EFE25_05135 [Levilactobacillus brevis]|nr:hypothetical protein AZI09_01370 [Levilactobacillus brevis]ARN96881.1 hypothetical protein AZI10_01360 [Levilactobacillus brevis]ARQ92739.1 hypothetical protein A6F60_03070 [Levilactobacillus brevis]ARW51693.1 hypothetical protein S101106_02240 [Levilactobacillus brevis]KIR07894.1 hypothetical protein RA16_11175 [Levilactobacillus brevis]
MKIRLRNYLICYVTIEIMAYILPVLWPTVFSFNWSSLKRMFIGLLVAIVVIEVFEYISTKRK